MAPWDWATGPFGCTPRIVTEADQPSQSIQNPCNLKPIPSPIGDCGQNGHLSGQGDFESLMP
jgi:hypothetical protein